MNLAPLRRTAFVTGCVGALSAGLLVAGCGGSTAAGSALSVTAAATSAATATSAAPLAASIPGRRYYTEEKPARIARLDGDKLVTVLAGGISRSAVASPDGQHTAWVTDKGDLMVADGNGRNAKKLIGKVDVSYEDHTWSPDSTRLLVRLATTDPQGGLGTEGIVTLANGAFTKLKTDLLHPKWSGDGKVLVSANGECGVEVHDTTGKLIRTVPGIGEEKRSKNPLWICVHSILSVNLDGTRVATWSMSMDAPGGDVQSMPNANSVFDTRTGEAVPLPVKGQIEAALHQADGTLLIRTGSKGVHTVTVIDPAGRVLAQSVEPAAVKNATLVSWTR
jgi:hypothetical protein